MNKTVCYKCDREPSMHCGECPVWLAGEEVSEKERIAYRKGLEDGVKLANQKENNEKSCRKCKRIDTCKDKIDARTIEDDIKYGMIVPNYIPGPNAECLVEERSVVDEYRFK